MKYYIYHIPGKKIGMTCDLQNRVTEQQGYEPHEYEVLAESKDVDFASWMEIQLQKQFGNKDFSKISILNEEAIVEE